MTNQEIDNFFEDVLGKAKKEVALPCVSYIMGKIAKYMKEDK